MTCFRSTLAAGLLFVASLPLAAQDRANWRATSTTARSITGDIAIGEDKLMINFAQFTIAQIRTLQPDEIAGVFNFEADAPVQGNLYRLQIPSTRRFLHKNTLCGTEDTQWMATAVSGKTLQVAFFSGPKMPAMTADALANSTALCGTYTYSR